MFKRTLHKSMLTRAPQKILAIVLLLMLSATVWPTSPRLQPKDFVGEYILQGQCPHSEQDDYLHSSLHLQENGHFRWQFESVFISAYGDWSIEDGHINLIGRLQPEAPIYSQRHDTENFFKIEPEENEWIVISEPNIEVQFYNNKGKVGAAVTDAKGVAILDMGPNKVSINKVSLRRENTKDTPQEFNLDKKSMERKYALFRVAPKGATRILIPNSIVKILEKEGPNDPSLEFREPIYKTNLIYYRKDVPPCSQ